MGVKRYLPSFLSVQCVNHRRSERKRINVSVSTPIPIRRNHIKINMQTLASQRNTRIQFGDYCHTTYIPSPLLVLGCSDPSPAPVAIAGISSTTLHSRVVGGVGLLFLQITSRPSPQDDAVPIRSGMKVHAIMREVKRA